MDLTPFLDLIRAVCVYIHLLGFGFGICLVLLEDWRMLSARRVHLAQLKRTHRALQWSLLTLAVSGLAIIGLDTGFRMAEIVASYKLLAKLSVVGLLFLNGLVLTRFAFRVWQQPPSDSRSTAVVLSGLGAISTASWLYAGFLGVASSFTPLLGYDGFISVYAIILMIAFVTAQLIARPRLVQRLQGLGAPDTLTPP